MNSSYTSSGNSEVSKQQYIKIGLLILAYSLFTFFGGDNARYEEYVKEGYLNLLNLDHLGIEPVYAVFASFSNGSLVLWKLMVYGIAIFISFVTIKKLKCNPAALAAFSVFALSSYGTTRGVLAYSIFLFAFTFLGSNSFWQKVLGIVLALGSIAFHSSMVLPICLIPLLFVRITKKRFIILLLLFPLLLAIFNESFEVIFNSTGIMDSQSGYKLETYTENADSTGTGTSFLMTVHNVLDWITIAFLLFFTIKADNKNLLPKPVSYISRVSFFVFYLSQIISFSNLPNSKFLSTRYVTMIPFFIYVSWSYFINNKEFVNIEVRKKYIYFSAFNTFFMFLVIVYYTSF